MLTVANSYHPLAYKSIHGARRVTWREFDQRTTSLAADLACVIQTLPAAPALIGASMGGAAALVLAGSGSPPALSALVMVDVVPDIAPAGSKKILGFMRRGQSGFASLEEAVEAVVSYNPHRAGSNDRTGLMKNLRLMHDGRLYWHWDPRILPSPDSLEPPGMKDLLSKAARNVRCPLLLIRGMQSDIVTDEAVAEFKRFVPQLEVSEVAGAGHMVAGDRNDAFNHAIFGFLARSLRDRKAEIG